MDGDGTSMFPKSHAFSFPFSELHQMLTKTLRIMIASPFLSRWARTLRPTYKPGSQNPRRIPKPPLFERHHFPFRFLATSPINFFRMEETPMSSFGGAATAGISSSAGRREMVGDIDCFELSPSSVLKLQQGDITSWFVDGATDAIVNAANEKMLGGGGVDGAIHRAAGPELKIACFEVPEVRPGVRCPTGEARITPGFQLPVSRVIHTVGPIFGAVKNPEVLLRNAYRNSLVLAKENNIQYIAFPAISCGVYRYPYDDASKIALSAIKEFPSDFKEVHFVLFSDDTYRAWLESSIELM